LTIHIVEDDYGVSDALAFLLGDAGHNTACYADAESFFEAGPPSAGDKVIVDLGLPGVEGIQVIKWLQGLNPPPGIIAISGMSQKEIENIIRGVNPPVVLRKPLTEEAIVAHL